MLRRAGRVQRPHRNMVRDHAQDLRLFGTPWARFGLTLMIAGWLLVPVVIQDDFWLSMLIYSGITAIGAVGLNLLTGYTGQISLRHAFFIGAGAYCAALFGGDLGLPLPLWLLGAAVTGGVLGAVIGPFTLRLRGHYLAIVTLGLVFIGQDKILAAPASLDAFWVREENLLPIGGPYQLQGVNSVEHYLAEQGGGGGAKICAMAQDDVYGEAGLAGVEAAAGHHGIAVTTVQKYTMGTEDFTGQIGALRRAGCEMIYLAATPGDAAKIWGTAAQARFTLAWYAQGPAYVEALAKSPIAPYLSEHVHVASFAPEWGDESVPGMKDLLEVIDKHAPKQKPDHYFAFGYMQAQAMTAVLEQAVTNGDLSRDGILRASREMGTLSFDGLGGDYVYGTASDRNPPRSVFMFAVDPKVPFGLRKIAEVTSPAAEEFEFAARK